MRSFAPYNPVSCPFIDPHLPHQSLGVIEIVQNNDRMDFLKITDMISNNLMRYSLASSTVDDVRIMMNVAHGPRDFQMPTRQELNEGTLAVEHMASVVDLCENYADDDIGRSMGNLRRAPGGWGQVEQLKSSESYEEEEDYNRSETQDGKV